MREFSKQNQELLCQALEEAQAELIKKFEINREVRAHHRARIQESLPCNRAARLDETEVTQGTVQVSPSLQKEQQQKEQQQQVLALRKQKQQKEQQLREAMETIELHRKVNAKATVARLAKKRMSLLKQEKCMALAPFCDGVHTGKKRSRNASWLFAKELMRMKRIWLCGESWTRTGKNAKN